MNKVFLLGHLTKDVDFKHVGTNNTAIANSTMAVNQKYKVSGELKEKVLFIDITFFAGIAEIANQYLKKGSQVLIEGRLVLEQWTAQDGSKRSKHSVSVESMKMLGSNSLSKSKEDKVNDKHPVPEIDIDDDEIPF